jgi:hypothetical protein
VAITQHESSNLYVSSGHCHGGLGVSFDCDSHNGTQHLSCKINHVLQELFIGDCLGSAHVQQFLESDWNQAGQSPPKFGFSSASTHRQIAILPIVSFPNLQSSHVAVHHLLE